MFLEFVGDDLGDATHAVRDEIVLITIHSVSLSQLLLVMIVPISEETPDLKYKEIPNAKALLQEHPTLIERLRGAWRDRTFKEIRNLSKISLF